jgi:amino acid permease
MRVLVRHHQGQRAARSCALIFADRSSPSQVLTIIGLIILGIALDCGAGDGDYIGFRYWRDPGLFVRRAFRRAGLLLRFFQVQHLGIGGSTGRFLGFWAVLIQAAFSYIGTEIVGACVVSATNLLRHRLTFLSSSLRRL